jgi:uncharacterized membrane protein YcjF (UPF0283 family)
MNLADATPLWPAELTAWGTLAVAVVAVAVALFAEWRASVRVRHERERSDRLLADEREHNAQVLADERTVAAKRLADQMAHGDQQLQQERQLAKDREQLAAAYLIQVTAARVSPAYFGTRITTTSEVPRSPARP